MIIEKPKLADRLDDILIRILAGFVYKSYINSLELKGNEKVLELGCGSGNLSKFIINKLSNKGSLTCIDNSNYWLSKAKKRLGKYKNIEFKLGDITELNLKDDYDIAIIHYVLHDINQNNRLRTIKTLKAKLKKNSRIYIREPTRKNHGMPAKKIEDLMLSSGLKKISSKEIYSLPLRSHYVGIFEKK